MGRKVFHINIQELAGGERRRFFRVAPAVEEPIVLKSTVGNFPLLEISGGGCRLPIAARAQLSESESLELCLPGCINNIRVRLRPVNIDEKAFGAEFVGLEPDLREVICDYVRGREIELARRFHDQACRNC